MQLSQVADPRFHYDINTVVFRYHDQISGVLEVSTVLNMHAMSLPGKYRIKSFSEKTTDLHVTGNHYNYSKF